MAARQKAVACAASHRCKKARGATGRADWLESGTNRGRLKWSEPGPSAVAAVAASGSGQEPSEAVFSLQPSWYSVPEVSPLLSFRLSCRIMGDNGATGVVQVKVCIVRSHDGAREKGEHPAANHCFTFVACRQGRAKTGRRAT